VHDPEKPALGHDPGVDTGFRVMAGLVPAIHDFVPDNKDVDARDERGHDGHYETRATKQIITSSP
jgi:hypothetical protein